VEESRSEDHPTHTITVAHRAIVELKLNPQNPRTHSTRQLRQIGESIKAFGFNVPVLIDAQLQVIAGHGRIAACQRLGWQSVPTICLEHLSEAQARAFMIADNRLTEIAVWADRLLAEQLKQLAELELVFSLEATGFAMAEIDLRIEGLQLAAQPDSATEDALPTVGPAVARACVLWLLEAV